jgi:choline dehydrogenase-like flavoprotein
VSDEFDVIVIGTGAGGGTVAHTIAQTGKRILLLERGDFLTGELGNWDPGPGFVDGQYISPDTWYDEAGTPLQPQVHYFVGGATKMYGRPCIGYARGTSASSRAPAKCGHLRRAWRQQRQPPQSPGNDKADLLGR